MLLNIAMKYLEDRKYFCIFLQKVFFIHCCKYELQIIEIKVPLDYPEKLLASFVHAEKILYSKHVQVQLKNDFFHLFFKIFAIKPQVWATSGDKIQITSII